MQQSKDLNSQKKDKKARMSFMKLSPKALIRALTLSFFFSNYFFPIRASLLRWPMVGSITLHRFNIFWNARVTILGIDSAIFNSALPR